MIEVDYSRFVEWLCYSYDIDINTYNNDSFCGGCAKGDLEFVKWLTLCWKC